MTFIEAEKEILGLFPERALISFTFEKQTNIRDTSYECTVIVILKSGGDAISFRSSTWSGVIAKIKIFLVPNGVPSDEEAPAEQEEVTVNIA